MSTEKDVKQFLQTLRGTGCKISQGRRNAHYLVITPSGQRVILPSTPRNAWRTLKNSRAELRRAGVEI